MNFANSTANAVTREGEPEAVISLAARAGEPALDHVEAGHVVVGGEHLAGLREPACVGEFAGLVLQEVAVEGEDDPGGLLGEVQHLVHGRTEGEAGALDHRSGLCRRRSTHSALGARWRASEAAQQGLEPLATMNARPSPVLWAK